MQLRQNHNLGATRDTTTKENRPCTPTAIDVHDELAVARRLINRFGQ